MMDDDIKARWAAEDKTLRFIGYCFVALAVGVLIMVVAFGILSYTHGRP